ncbi:hypothetical protein BH24ACT2_BH24ACT2_01160 [soil metagenome]
MTSAGAPTGSTYEVSPSSSNGRSDAQDLRGLGSAGNDGGGAVSDMGDGSDSVRVARWLPEPAVDPGRQRSDDELIDLATTAATGDARARRSVATLLAGPRPDQRSVGVFVDELARRASAGSEPATELLIEVIDGLDLARPGVRRILVDDDEAADALQDVLVAVAETIGSFRSESRFTTWLHQVARNKAVACLRRRGDRPWSSATTPVVPSASARRSPSAPRWRRSWPCCRTATGRS